MIISKSLLGKIVIKGIIHTLTGLHIGAGRESIEIGALENTVLVDPVTKQPYIPGSSIKGKMRSLLERRIATEKDDPSKFFKRSLNGVNIHVCDSKEEAYNCPVCRLFGSSGSNISLALISHPD